MKSIQTLILSILLLASGVEASTGSIIESFSTIVLVVCILALGFAGLGYYARSKNYIESSKPTGTLYS